MQKEKISPGKVMILSLKKKIKVTFPKKWIEKELMLSDKRATE